MLIKWLHNSGAPKMFAWLADSLATEGHDVMVYTYQDCEGKSVALSNKVHHVHELLADDGFLGKVKHIRRAMKSFDADVSISFLLDANVYNTFACLKLRTKSVICERNDPFKPRYYKLKFWKPWFRLADGAVFQLPKVADYYSNIKGSTAIIPNPVRKPVAYADLPFQERDDVVVTVGRIDLEQKRHDVLVSAFAKFHLLHPSYKLLIYGGGDSADTEKLSGLVAQLNMQEYVSLKGSVENPLEKICHAKFFVLSSDFEGIPNALVEAMSMGLPCISTDCRPGGAALLIEHGKNGLLVSMGDSDSLCQEMEHLANSPEFADSIGREARNIVNTFSEAKVVSAWNQFIEKIR